jgi:PKD repeat protein
LTGFIPWVHAASYSLGTIPFITQEGSSVTIVFTVSGATGSTLYQFRFFLRDPATKIHQSVLENYTTLPGQTQFTLPPFYYPTLSFPGPNSLVGQYIISVDQIKPVAIANVQATYFFIILTDNTQYQRTDTVNIHATGYNASESVTVKIATQTTSTTVFTQTLPASTTGIVITNWKIPRNATIDSNGYLVTITGTTTVKTPADAQGFTISPATMSISALNSLKSSYQRTETMSFSFQPLYPDGTIASTGAALITLARPNGVNVTLTAAYSGGSQTFNATYKTSTDNQTGTWKATLATKAFTDAYGNSGPSTTLANSPQLVAATLTLSVVATNYVPIGQQVKFNATITYPDGTGLTSGTVGAYLLYSGSPPVNDTVPVIFDSGLQEWVGSYAPQSSDPGGLYSLVIKASDSPIPPNAGSATKAVTLQDKPPVATFTPSSTSGPTGTPITFDGTGSYDPDGTIITWSWIFGDTTTGSGSVVAHTFTTAGTYTVTLTVTDNGGYSSSTSSQITITDRPPVVSATPAPTTPSPGQSVTLSITASDPDGTISTTKVDWGDGTVDNLGAVSSDTHTYALPGSTTSSTFTVTVTVTDNSGSSTSTNSQVTVTDQPPAVSFTPSTTTANAGQAVTLAINASDPDGTISTTSINWGDGKIDNFNYAPTIASHTYNSTGSAGSKTYTITVRATDSRGQTSTTSSSVTVQSSPPSSNGNVSLPLYYFGIIAALVGAILVGGFLAVRRHKVTHAKLKIDLEAVKSEAGRIENQEFFQSVKDQLKKDKDD